MQLTIDGKTVTAQAGESVLDCALRHRIDIPRLCTHPALEPFGACRMCIVKIEGMRGFPTSCTTPATEGMVVETDTPDLRELRRKILELTLVEHPSACLLCDKQELCEEYRPKSAKAGRSTGCHTCNNKEWCTVRVLSDQLQVHELPAPPLYRGFALDRSDPFIDRDLNLCILCGRCVRVCKAHQGWGVIDFIGRGSETRIGEAFGRSLIEAGCRFCGSCVDVCPTGSLADRYAKWYGAPSRYTATTCTLCDEGCAVTVHTSARERAVMARGIDTHVPLCVLGRFAMPEFLNGVTRLGKPQVRVNNVLRSVPWPEAMKAMAERLQPFVGPSFALVCDTTSTIEDRHVFRKFTSEAMQSPHCIEAQPDERGQARTGLPEGVRAVLLTGDFVDAAWLEHLDLVIVQDAYPTPVTERAHFSLPVTLLAEVTGTWVDGRGFMRPLRKACEPPAEARPDWQILCELARALGAAGFDYTGVNAIAAEIGAYGARPRIVQDGPPPAATDVSRRRTHFRGHLLEERVRGLRDLPIEESAAPAAAVGG